MSRTLQFKRYNATQLANTIGANGEIIINTTTRAISVHDGVTPGGYTPTAIAADSFARTLAQSAFDYANTISGGGGTSIDQFARTTANTTSNNITIIQGVNTTQNTNIINADTKAQAAFDKANTFVDTYTDQVARDTANVSIGVDVTQNTRITIIEGVNTTQNTNITTVDTKAQAAFDKANTFVDTYTDQVARDTANTNSNNIVIIQGVNTTQNTNITTIDTKAQAAFDKANTSSSGTIATAFVLVVDPLGDNNTANGSITKPFATIQAAHNYAVDNVTSTSPVVIQVNPGRYTENLTLTRALTHIVGLTTGAVKPTRIIGSITTNLITPVLGGTSNDIFSIENLVVSDNAVTLGGNQSYMFLAKNVLFTTSQSTGNNLKSTNTSNTGIKIELTDCLFENQNSSDVSIDLSNVWYGNFNQLACYSGSNTVMKISNSNVIMFNSRLSTSTGNNVIEAVSGFGGGVSLTGGDLVITNSKANGNGINISSGATVNIVDSTFQVGTSAGTGRAVYGVAGSIFVNGTNTIIYGTNAKTSTSITNVPHTISLSGRDVIGYTQSAFDKANSSNVLAQAAFNAANTASGGGLIATVNIDSTNTTITTASSGGFITLAGTTCTITLPDPTTCSGANYTIWQNTSSQMRLFTPAGAFYGPAGSAADTKTLLQATTQQWRVFSDGTSWILFAIKSA